MASLQARRESEGLLHDIDEHQEGHVGLTTESSEYDVNRNLDMRRATFHPSRADVQPSDADEKPSILGKLMGVLCAEGRTPASGDKVAAPASAGPEDVSSHPAFENLSHKLKDKGERVRLLGEKAVRPHTDSASFKGEDAADSGNGVSETGFQSLKGELGKLEVEDSRSPPSEPVQSHIVVDLVPGYVAETESGLGEPEFADASSTFQQSSVGLGSYAGPCVGDEPRVEEKKEPVPVNVDQGKDTREDSQFLGPYESGHNGEEFADAPSAFQEIYDKSIESTEAETEAPPDVEQEKMAVWINDRSTKKDEGRHGLERHTISSSSALDSSDQAEDLAKFPVSSAPRERDLSQLESDKDLEELPENEFALETEANTADAPSAVPQFYDEGSEGAGAEEELHPDIKEVAKSTVEEEGDVEDEVNPGFFTRVKQTLWSNSPSSTEEFERQSSSSSSSEEVTSATQKGELLRQKDLEGISAPLAERVLFPSDGSEEEDENYPDTATEEVESNLSQTLHENVALEEVTREQGDSKAAERDENLSGQDEKMFGEAEMSPSFLGSIGRKIGLSGLKSSSDSREANFGLSTLKREQREEGGVKEATTDKCSSEQDEKTPTETEKTSSFLGSIGKKIGLSGSKSMSEADKGPIEQEQKSPSEQQESSGFMSNIASKLGLSGSARCPEEETD